MVGFTKAVPFQASNFRKAAAARPDLHPVAAALEMLAGPRQAPPSSAQLRKRRDEDLALFVDDAATGAHLRAEWGRRIEAAERREAREAAAASKLAAE